MENKDKLALLLGKWCKLQYGEQSWEGFLEESEGRWLKVGKTNFTIDTVEFISDDPTPVIVISTKFVKVYMTDLLNLGNAL